MSLKFALLDPRSIPVALEANERVFASSNEVAGVEVTVPELAARCVMNIDPQHTGGNSKLAAIEEMLDRWQEFSGDATLVTVRADLDSVGAMAVANILHHGEDFDWTKIRIKLVAAADTFANSGWPGPQLLPTLEHPWGVGASAADSSRDLAAINATVMDFKLPIDLRVLHMENWLFSGAELAQYRAQVDRDRLDMINALYDGRIFRATLSGGRIAAVVSTHRAATAVGYALAPVVIAFNPEFRLGGGDPHGKFTICAYDQSYVDIKGALAELATLEPGWGGSPTIGGSPQGVSSKLSMDQVVNVVEKYLK